MTGAPPIQHGTLDADPTVALTAHADTGRNSAVADLPSAFRDASRRDGIITAKTEIRLMLSNIWGAHAVSDRSDFSLSRAASTGVGR